MRIDKDLVAASATPLVLGILADGESYGYAILKRVDELSGGRMQWTDGMLYPLLHRLERLGLVEASWGTSDVGRRRKHYAITAAGREALVERQAQWDVVAHALQQVWRSAQDGLQSPPRVAEGGPDGRRDRADGRGEPRPARRARGPDRPVARVRPAPGGDLRRGRRRDGGPPARAGRGPPGHGPRRRRGVPRRREAHGHARRPVARVRAGALRASVEAARPGGRAGGPHPFVARARGGARARRRGGRHGQGGDRAPALGDGRAQRRAPRAAVPHGLPRVEAAGHAARRRRARRAVRRAGRRPQRVPVRAHGLDLRARGARRPGDAVGRRRARLRGRAVALGRAPHGLRAVHGRARRVLHAHRSVAGSCSA